MWSPKAKHDLIFALSLAFTRPSVNHPGLPSGSAIAL